MFAPLFIAAAVAAPPAWVEEYERARAEYAESQAAKLEVRVEELYQLIKDSRYEIPDPRARRAKIRKTKADIQRLESQARELRRLGADRQFDFKKMLPDAMGQLSGLYELETVFPNGDLQLRAREAVYDSYTSRVDGSVRYRFSHHRNLGTVRMIGVSADEAENGRVPKGLFKVHTKTAKAAVVERVATESEFREHFPDPKSRRRR